MGDELDKWMKRHTQSGLVESWTLSQLEHEQEKQPSLHAWLEHTWEKLEGDPDDIEHASYALASGAHAIATGNMTCIDAKTLAGEAAKWKLDIPTVLKRDAVLKVLAKRVGVKAGDLLRDCVEEATAYRANQSETDQMLQGLKTSFPETVARALGERTAVERTTNERER